MACDAGVGGHGHHRVASQVLSAQLDLTCAKCLCGFQVHRHYSLYIHTSHLFKIEVSIGSWHSNDFSEVDIGSSIMVEHFSLPGVTPGGYVRRSGINA